ncbi:trypsin-like peptidase domain-containing protein [Kitasatospora kazusensis]|uniref:Trypsin-like peptidase domain-containing protein n=1 Tax=Kitasatospora kazusensis TaxID=407974 RepID=A0ABN2ZX80_9ACTN
MNQYFTADEIHALHQAGIEAGYADNNRRTLLLDGILPQYQAMLRTWPEPSLQLRSDLVEMNKVERLIDGSVPLEVWLRNAVGLTTVAAPAAVFRQALDEVTRIAAGEPDVLAGAPPDEFKEAVIHRDDMVPFDFLRSGDRAGLAVACVKVRPYQNGSPYTGLQASDRFAGTGWLIAPQLLITNHHVVTARKLVEGRQPEVGPDDFAQQAASVRARFDFEAEEIETEVAQATGLVANDPTLDYAILRLAEKSLRPVLRVGTEALTVTSGRPVAVNIIQHPGGLPKQVALRNNLVYEADGRDVRYFTDTRTGSSGSPVCTDDWTVVALHRGARQVTNVNFQGKGTAFINVGTQMSSIMRHLKEHQPEIHDEIAAQQG